MNKDSQEEAAWFLLELANKIFDGKVIINFLSLEKEVRKISYDGFISSIEDTRERNLTINYTDYGEDKK